MPPIRSASSRPIASPRPKPLSGPAARPRWKRSKTCSRSSGGMPGPWSVTETPALPAAGGGDRDQLALRAVAERVVDQDPHHARDGVGVAAAPAALGRRQHAQLDVELARAQVELGRHRARQLAELDRLRAQLDGGVEPAEVEQLAGQRREPAQLAARVGDLELGVLDVHAPVAQVLLEQLHRALEHGQRRAQLVRGGGDERAPRDLLAPQRLLHAGERARQVADLVAAVVLRGRRVRALGGDPQGGGAQARRAGAAACWRARRRARSATSMPTPAATISALRTWSTAVVTSVSRRLGDERADDARRSV